MLRRETDGSAFHLYAGKIEALAKVHEAHPDKHNYFTEQWIGAVTIDGNQVTRKPAYYSIAHAAKFVRPGSVRIASNMISALPNVAFKTPRGR